MFTPAQINTIARRAHHAIEGKGEGHTVFDDMAMRGRYVVGGYTASLLFPIGEATARIREGIMAWGTSPLLNAHTLGYWEHDGTVHVDLGTMTSNWEHALTLARKRGELAIYDTVERTCHAVADYARM